MDNKNDNKNNNFFNENPLLVFILFSIVVIILFRLMVGDSSNSGMNGFMQSPKILKTQRVAYSDIKRLIKDDNIASVKITNTTIEAVDKSGTTKYIRPKLIISKAILDWRNFNFLIGLGGRKNYSLYWKGLRNLGRRFPLNLVPNF